MTDSGRPLMPACDKRPYAPGDFAACMDVFAGNSPRFFDLAEREEFSAFLKDLPKPDWPYLVVLQGEQVLASGGVIFDLDKSLATFAWGMVARGVQGQGVGRCLTQARLDLALNHPQMRRAGLSTSQLTRGFYERFGFSVQRVISDGFGPGLDRVDMELQLR